MLFDGLDDVVRPAGDDDAIAGVPARFVAAPASTEQAAAVLRAAAEAGLAVVVRGAGTRQDWAAPPHRLDLVLETRRLTGVVEHAAGDLIVVVRAGTGMAELRDKLSPAGQQLALDTGSQQCAGQDPTAGREARPDATAPDATVGGTVALGVSGPRRLLYGGPRELLIGLTMVRPDGRIAHAGGKVVKNVAGYDLGKLLTGSYGTLGLITRCAFRLHPLPHAAQVVTCRVADPVAAGRLVAAVRDAQLVPSAVEIEAPCDAGVEVAVLVEGVPAGVADRVATLRRLLGDPPAHPTPTGATSAGRVPADVAAGADPAGLGAVDGAPTWWGAYPWVSGDTGIKLTAALSAVPSLVTAAWRAAERHQVALTVRGSAGTGVLYAGLSARVAPEVVAEVIKELRVAAGQAQGHAVVLSAPAEVRDRVDLWGPVPGLALMRRIKDQFDPDARFAPGRFVGGI